MDITTLREYRIFNLAIIDFVLTFYFAYILNNFCNLSSYIPVKNNQNQIYYLSLIPIALLVHLIFNQNTFLNRKVFTKEINIYQSFVLVNIFLLIYFIL